MFIHPLKNDFKIYDPEKHKDQWEVCQMKHNGHRICFFKQTDGSVVAFGKDQREHLELLSRYPHLKLHPFVAKLYDPRVPILSSFDCEMVVYNSDDGFVNAPELVTPALCSGSIDKIHFKCFAVPFWDSRDLRNWKLTEFDGTNYSNSLNTNSFHDNLLFHVRIWFSRGDAKVEQMIEKFSTPITKQTNDINPSLEGWVLKTYNYSGDWFKVKKTKTVDLVVMGIVPGKGKYTNQIGSLVCGLQSFMPINSDSYSSKPNSQATVAEYWTVLANVGSGIPDDIRAMLTYQHKQESIIGTVIEVEYNRIGTRKRLIHPRFLRLRPDKNPRFGCGLNQFPEHEQKQIVK